MFLFDSVNNATDLQALWEDEDLRILVYVLSSTMVIILMIWYTMCLGSILVGLLFFTMKSKSKVNNGARQSLINLESKDSKNTHSVKDTDSKADSDTDSKAESIKRERVTLEVA